MSLPSFYYFYFKYLRAVCYRNIMEKFTKHFFVNLTDDMINNISTSFLIWLNGFNNFFKFHI